MMRRSVRTSMRPGIVLCWLVGALLVGWGKGTPVALYQSDPLPVPLVPELGARLNTINNRLQEQRLPLPSPQDLEAIKKVAQILVMLGEQVIPAIIGEAPPSNCDHIAAVEDIPNDPVNEKQVP